MAEEIKCDFCGNNYKDLYEYEGKAVCLKCAIETLIESRINGTCESCGDYTTDLDVLDPNLCSQCASIKLI